MKKKIAIQGIEIHLEEVNENDYVSLTDIAKKTSKEPRYTIINWIRNIHTIRFLIEWEVLHNPDFNRVDLHTVKDSAVDNRIVYTPKKWIKDTKAIGIISKAGRYGGGTFAHKDIALQFCGWLSPEFQVWMMKAFTEMIEKEFQRKSLHWHISKITDNVEEIRNLLDSIPHQDPVRKRTDFLEEE